jgi:lysophospholipase L1-like esterase
MRLLMGLIVAITVLGLAEVGARLTGLQPAYDPDGTGSWRTMPNLVRHTMMGMREPHQFRISTDAEGLRTSLSPARTAGTTRIAVMGDSTVFGWGVQDDESISAFAQAALAREGHPNIELLNAGQPGYSTGMVAWLFEHAVSQYEPDWTIVFISMHDFNFTLISDVERVHGPTSLSAAWRGFLVRHVALYEGLRRIVFPLADKAQLMPTEYYRQPIAYGDRRVQRVSNVERTYALDRMQAAAQTWNGNITVGYLPFYSDLMEGPSGRSLERPGLRHSEVWARTNGLPLFDLRACCGPGADAYTFPFDHGHLNAAGNRAVGEALAEQILRHLSPQLQ